MDLKFIELLRINWRNGRMCDGMNLTVSNSYNIIIELKEGILS